MTDEAREIQGVRVLVCGAQGGRLANERDAAEVVGTAWEHKSTMVALPVERLGPDFFRLSTRIAGEVIQKFVTYHLRVAIVGDISAWTADSAALRDFVYESNRGDTVWFVETLEALEQRLAAPTASRR